MKNRLKIAVAGLICAMLALGAYRGGSVNSALAEADSFSDGQVKSIEKVVHDYLISHPEVMLEIQEAYEKKAEAKRVEASRAKMPDFYKSLSSMKGVLDKMSVGGGDLTLVEFFDYNCGYCRATLPELTKLIDSDKNLKVQFLEFPILAPGSLDASKVAIAAANQGKYFEFHKAMFSAGRASKESAMKVAQQIGLDIDRVNKDLDAPETQQTITQISELGKRMMIDGTPSFIVGDKTNPGAADFDQLKELIDSARKEGCKSCAADASGVGTKAEKKS